MTESEIESRNVTRYCKPSSLDDGVLDESAFEKRKGEKYLSVYWLEFFQKETERENIVEVRNYMKEKTRFNCKPNGSFAVINIEESKGYILEELSEMISCKEETLPHCGLYHNADDFLIAKLLVECVRNNYRVKDIDNYNSPPSSLS